MTRTLFRNGEEVSLRFRYADAREFRIDAAYDGYDLGREDHVFDLLRVESGDRRKGLDLGTLGEPPDPPENEFLRKDGSAPTEAELARFLGGQGRSGQEVYDATLSVGTALGVLLLGAFSASVLWFAGILVFG